MGVVRGRGSNVRLMLEGMWFISLLDLRSSLVLVIGTTNRIDSIDPCLRRAGRFDKELSLGIPNETSRKQSVN